MTRSEDNQHYSVCSTSIGLRNSYSETTRLCSHVIHQKLKSHGLTQAGCSLAAKALWLWEETRHQG
eukprot:1159798-Pelagomonas_calceolata.AAC.1